MAIASLIIGIISTMSAITILIPDVIKTIKNKKNRMPSTYLITKSISVIINIGYSISLWMDFGLIAGIPLLTASTIKGCCLIIFCYYTNFNLNSEDVHLLINNIEQIP